MSEPQIVQLARETRSSIEVTRNAKGDPQWTIKAYCEDGQEEEALDRIRSVELQLRNFYLFGGVERAQQMVDEIIVGNPELEAQLLASITAIEAKRNEQAPPYGSVSNAPPVIGTGGK